MKSSVKFVSVDSICLQDERQTATQCGLDFQTLCIGALQGRGWRAKENTTSKGSLNILCVILRDRLSQRISERKKKGISGIHVH